MGDRLHAEGNRNRSCRAPQGCLVQEVFCEERDKPLIASQAWVAWTGGSSWVEFLGAPGRQISAEEVADIGRDVVIAAWCGAGDPDARGRKSVADRRCQGTRAARSSRVYSVRDEHLNPAAPAPANGVDALPLRLIPNSLPGTKGVRQIASVPPSTA